MQSIGKEEKGIYFKDVMSPLQNMNNKIAFLLVTLVMLDIIDGDFKTLSILDGVKIAMYIICFALLAWDRKGDKS